MSSLTDVEIANTEVMTATVPDLVAGRLYTFTITAENSNGPASIDCGPVRYDIGEGLKYMTDSFPQFMFAYPIHTCTLS